MTDAALQTRLIKLMETDWRTQAAALLEERRKEGNDAYVLFFWLLASKIHLMAFSHRPSNCDARTCCKQGEENSSET